MDLLSQAARSSQFLPRLAVRLKVPAAGKLKSRSPTCETPRPRILGYAARAFARPSAATTVGRSWEPPAGGKFFRRNAAALDDEGLWWPLHRRKPSQTRNATARQAPLEPSPRHNDFTTFSPRQMKPPSAGSPQRPARANAPGTRRPAPHRRGDVDRARADVFQIQRPAEHRALRPAGLFGPEIFAFTGGALSRVSAICDVSR